MWCVEAVVGCPYAVHFVEHQQFKRARRADADQSKASEAQPVTVRNWHPGRSLCDVDESATSAMQDEGYSCIHSQRKNVSKLLKEFMG